MRLAPMMRSLDLILLVGLVAIVVWTFKVNHESREALERVRELERQIAAEKTEIDLLKSDWSLLTNPARLQELVERYSKELELQDVEASQITTPNQLPGMKQPNLGGKTENHVGIDRENKTGSVTPQTGGEQ